MLNPRAFVAFLPISLIKARTDSEGRRLVEICASTETVDLQGDCILQKALLDSAGSFVANGHIDIDHKSELYEEFGITNPEAWIVGKPLEVWDGGDGQTMVLCQMRKSETHDPDAHSWDAVWDSLQTEPPVAWRASVYGFLDPAQTTDCRVGGCSWDRAEPPPTRFLVAKFDWKSLAFTRNPVNTGIHKYARVVSAKSWVGAVRLGGVLNLVKDDAPATLQETQGGRESAIADPRGAWPRALPQTGGLVGAVEAHNPAKDAERHKAKEKAYEDLDDENRKAEVEGSGETAKAAESQYPLLLEIELSKPDGLSEMLDFWNEVRRRANWGHSFEVSADLDSGDGFGFFMDGDGADKVGAIRANGKEIEDRDRQEATGEAKAAGLLGAHRPPPRPSVPTIDSEIAGGSCPTCGGLRDAPTIPMWRRHLSKCLGWSPADSELGANAAMYRLILSNGWGRRRGSKKFPEAPELTPEVPGPTIMGPGNQSLNGGRFRPGHLANTRP